MHNLSINAQIVLLLVATSWVLLGVLVRLFFKWRHPGMSAREFLLGAPLWLVRPSHYFAPDRRAWVWKGLALWALGTAIAFSLAREMPYWFE